MPVSYELEQDNALLIFRIEGGVDDDALEEIFSVVGKRLSKNLKQILVLRDKADTEYEIDAGIEFGKRAGDLLADTEVLVAVVKAPEHMGDVAINASMYINGVLTGEFVSEKEARAWLKLKSGETS